MIRHILSVLIVLAIIVVAGKWLLSSMPEHDTHDHAAHEESMEEDINKGPNNGRLLVDGDFAIEITIFETGVPPEFHVYAYQQGHAIEPANVQLTIELHRLSGDVDVFRFTPQADYLKGEGVVTEPHSFDVLIKAEYQGQHYQWSYENYEGRTQISNIAAEESGIKTERASSTTISEYVFLNGRVQINPNKKSSVRARYPGIVKSTRKKLGDKVRKGESLLTIQNNVSLQNYDVFAPIGGVITKRNVQTGESTDGNVLFEITDLNQVWITLDVFSKDIEKIKPEQPVLLTTLDGKEYRGVIKDFLPAVSVESQTVQAIVPLDNTSGELRPGQIIKARVSIAEHDVSLAVKQSGIQQFRDFKVVYARFDDMYEVRMLDLGRADEEWVEVLGGLKPSTEYVTENSYLIKADIEKSGASHDH
ncbi:MAG: HlyD family efflux transporter periplasmic adaptor subunit [Proteobacteria bacterium]|nr:HlyD family efflux transporter periplasmic adaptor subunit [Pseudomonadota bacterium]NOG58889.1 HlyD family efflux transporter periplasmic adaptor subunit [Pseudomonadota bacterium]